MRQKRKPKRPATITSLARHIRMGDSRAFDEFVKLQGTRIEAAAKENKIPVQTLLIALWENISGNIGNLPQAAAISFAVQRILRRRSSKMMAAAEEMPAKPLRLRITPRKTPLQILEREDIKEHVKEIVFKQFQKKNPKRARRYTNLFMDYYFGGLTLEELAQRRSVRYQMIQNRLKQVFNILKDNSRFVGLVRDLRGVE